MEGVSLKDKLSCFTCKLAISERPARLQTTLAVGLASATQRNTKASLSSSRSISGDPIRRIVGASVGYKYKYKIDML